MIYVYDLVQSIQISVSIGLWCCMVICLAEQHALFFGVPTVYWLKVECTVVHIELGSVFGSYLRIFQHQNIQIPQSWRLKVQESCWPVPTLLVLCFARKGVVVTGRDGIHGKIVETWVNGQMVWQICIMWFAQGSGMEAWSTISYVSCSVF